MTSRYRVPLLMLTGLTLIAEPVCAAAAPDAAARPAFTWQFEYDAADRITRLTDVANRSIIVQYEEDNQGNTTKLTKHFFDDTTVTYQFDRVGRPTAMSDTTGTVHYTYDSAQRLSTVTRHGQPDIVYGYDTLDRLTSMRLGDRFEVRYTYDFLGCLKTMDTPAGTVAYDYHPAAAARVRILPNGIQTTWRYHPNGSLRSITHAQNKKVLAEFTYRYGADGLLQEVHETDTYGSASVAYAYDAQQQLIRVTHSAAGVTEFSYDPLGNRLSVAEGQSSAVRSTYDWAGRLMTVADQACRHTDVGSLASYTADTVALELHYNAANLVARAIGPQAQVTYRYDGKGHLVERQVGQSTVQFLVNPLDPIWRPLQARPSSGPTTSYVWEGDTPLMALTGKRVVFFLYDHLGSVRYRTDDRGQITERWAYPPFGVPHQPPEPHALQPAFAGLFFDSATRLYITPGRSYSPHLGRFVQVDPQHRIPYGSPADLSPYTYSGNDPVNYVDRTGAVRECVQPTCLSWQETIKQWELERQRQLSEATAHQLQMEALQKARDAALDTLDPLLKHLGINNRILSKLGIDDRVLKYFAVDRMVREALKETIRTPMDAMIKGDRITATELIQKLSGDIQAAGDAGLLSPEQVKKYLNIVAKADMQTWAATTRMLLFDFGRTARNLQNLFRQQLGLGPSNFAMREARAAAVRIKQAAGIFAAALEVPETVMQYIDLVGKSMMAMNPAVYLTHRTPLGLQGYGTAPLAGGTYRWSETLSTSADRWWQRGDIHRVHWDRLDTSMGRYERGMVQNTPATSPIERFMMHWYPVGSYYDPDQTVERRTTRVTEQYRVHTVGGHPEVIGLMEHRSEPASTLDGPHPWMQDYPLKRLALPSTTPALVVEGSQTETKQQAEGPHTRVITTTRQARIYGGVRLAPEDKDVRTVIAVPQARQLETDLSSVMATAPAVGTVVFDSKGTTYTAAVLPGDRTRSVGANRLEVTDLTVPVEGETRLGLTRTFHSFFNPRGMFGEGWSLDLPRLEPRPQPVQRVDDRTQYRTTFQLTSPLGSWSVAFRESKRLTGEVNGELMVPENTPEILGLASGTEPRLGVPTHQVLWRDGRRWYFDQDGDLLAWSEPGLFVVYRRDKAHRVQHIEGWHGDQRRAEIHLDYDADGHLTQARGSNGSTATYTYDTQGRFASVSTTSGDAPGRKTVTVAYTYHKWLLTAIRQDGDVVQEFAHNAQGQLIWERRGNEQATVYTMDANGGQTTITAHGPGAEHRTTKTVYDAALRPVQRLAADGTKVAWQYASNGEVTTMVVHPDRTTTRLTRSADGRQTTWTLAEGGAQAITRDAAGRLTRLTTPSGNTVQQEWRPDGRLAMVAHDGLAMQPHYQADGRLTEVLLFPPSRAKAKQLDTWLRVEVDEQGRPVTISDSTGMRTILGYDATGALSGRLATVDGQPQGVQLTRDDQGRVTALESSWGTTQQRRYGDTGQLAELTMRQSFGQEPAAQARVQFDDGKIRHLTTFHGEEIAVSYATQGPHAGQIERVQLPNQLTLQYGYDGDNLLAAIVVGSSYQLQYSYDAQGRLARVTQTPVHP